MSGRVARGIDGRMIITGTLVLETPAHFGNGDSVGVTDMPLLRDPRDGSTPLLPGASIAGALRSHLREIERGYGVEGRQGDLSERLFGRIEHRMAVQSWLMVDDALGTRTGIELRDGVALDPVTRTAEEKKKFDFELLAAGTAFTIRFEFLESDASRDLLPALATALDGFATGAIGLGQRKRRGLGRCSVSDWSVRRYILTTPAGLIGWLNDSADAEQCGPDICALLGVQPIADERESFSVRATMRLSGSILIRSSSAKPGSPDMIQLESARNGRDVSVVSGTSLAGAIRARALTIAQTVFKEHAERGKAMIDRMFGPRFADDRAAIEQSTLSDAGRPMPGGSRMVVEECVIEGGRSLVQSRVKLDRFTGGAFPGALFSQQPLWSAGDARFTLKLALRNPTDAEVGLLLLVLKDLWTGDLPLGGESAVGRGRLQGVNASLTLRRQGTTGTWGMAADDGGHLDFDADGAPEALEQFVAALWEERALK